MLCGRLLLHRENECLCAYGPAASISALISVGIGILPMWGGRCCIVKMSAFVTALISIGIGISPIYQLILRTSAQPYNSTHEIQHTNLASN